MTDPVAVPVGSILLPMEVRALAARVEELTAEHGDGLISSEYGRHLVIFTEGTICECGACLFAVDQIINEFPPISMQRMVVCPDCGNKRCPQAWSHENVCTQSNEPGQTPVRKALA